MNTMIQYVLYLAILVVLAIPLGAYIKNVMSGEKTFLSKVLTPCENLIYKVMRVDREEQMTWKKYAVSVLTFSGVGLVFLFLLQLVQGVLPGNPQHLSGVKWDLAFNTSASFITNTNWQAYSGESTLSYLTQALGLTVQNFVSAATGIAVLFALIRGFIKVKSSGLGSFWVDLTRIVVHILLPLNLVISLLLVGGGVIQNLKSAETVSLVEPIAVSAEGEILEDAVIDLDTETVTVDGEIVSNAQIVTEQFVPMGPCGQPGRNQTDRHQRRRLYGRQLRTSFGKSQCLYQSDRNDFHSTDSGGTVFHIRFCGKEQEAGYCNLYGNVSLPGCCLGLHRRH